jgi:hypothetical protein
MAVLAIGGLACASRPRGQAVYVDDFIETYAAQPLP